MVIDTVFLILPVFLLLLSLPSIATAQSSFQAGRLSQSKNTRTLYSDVVTLTVTAQPPAETVNGTDVMEEPQLNGADPNYAPTEAELKFLAEKEARVTQYMYQMLNAAQPETAGTVHTLNVGVSGRWKEPDDKDHVNYCGPGATQVALDARLPASSVPNINTVGADEHIDPLNGVKTTAIRDELNRLTGEGYYAVSWAPSQADLEWRVRVDIDDGFSLVTALKTGGMPGWRVGKNVKHIVATYGYATGTPIRVYYVETAAPTAGFTGSYFNNKSATGFWPWVSANNSQVW